MLEIDILRNSSQMNLDVLDALLERTMLYLIFLLGVAGVVISGVDDAALFVFLCLSHLTVRQVAFLNMSATVSTAASTEHLKDSSSIFQWVI